LGAGIRVSGRIEGEEDLRVEGNLEGSVHLSRTLFIDSQGVVVADVHAHDVVISGIVVGNVTAENSVMLNPGAKLLGDIDSPRLIIADGAAFRGRVAMGGAPAAGALRERARNRSVAASSSNSAASSVSTNSRNGARTTATHRTATLRPGKGDSSPRAEASRVAAIRPQPRDDDEKTAVVRHPQVAKEKAGAPKAKKAPPRARVPKPGKRRVTRR
jgi:cytoskeletal protein CcmA (bactofilin family)